MQFSLNEDMNRDLGRFASESPVRSSKRLEYTDTNREVPLSSVVSTPEGILEEAKKTLSPFGKSVNALADLVCHTRDAQIKQLEEIAKQHEEIVILGLRENQTARGTDRRTYCRNWKTKGTDRGTDCRN